MLLSRIRVRVSSPDCGARSRPAAAPTRPPTTKPARKAPISLSRSDIVSSPRRLTALCAPTGPEQIEGPAHRGQRAVGLDGRIHKVVAEERGCAAHRVQGLLG